MLAPLLETPRQRDVPFAIPHFPRRCMYKLQKAACNACSENAKGSLRRCVAQTSFRAEMQKEWTVVSSAFPQPAVAGTMKNERGKSQYKRDNELADDAPDEGKELPDRNPKELER